MQNSAAAASPYPSTTLPERWWERVSAMLRPHLKLHGKTLNELTARLDEFKAHGIDALEVFAPSKGGVCYHGLDTLDYFEIDPAIGTMDDFKRLVNEAHRRHIAVIAFHNLGYGHEQFPAFLKACDDVRAGIDSPETRMFSWSDTGQDKMDRSLAPHFMNDLHGNWRWSERAQKYFWVKWEGEKGGYHLPQFNFGDPGWQNETRRIIDFWMRTGIDGMVIDAVNWYIGANWEITRYSMTDVLNLGDNQFSQPEGAGGFNDDPVPWITQGGFNCVMDYSIKKWWDGIDVIRDAILAGDPRPIEVALRTYRDRVVAAGGVCYIDPPTLDDLPVEARLLGAALTASMGELLIIIGEQKSPQPESFRDGLSKLLFLRKEYPALCASGLRKLLQTSDDTRLYAFIRELPGEKPVVAVFNFQPTAQRVSVNLAGQSIINLVDLFTGENVMTTGDTLTLDLPAYGFRLLAS